MVQVSLILGPTGKFFHGRWQKGKRPSENTQVYFKALAGQGLESVYSNTISRRIPSVKAQRPWGRELNYPREVMAKMNCEQTSLSTLRIKDSY